MPTYHSNPPGPGREGYDPRGGTYRLHHDPAGETPLSYTVLRGVAAITGEQLADLEPLAKTIDPDALEALFSPVDRDAPTRARLELRYQGCTVSVFSDGRVLIEPPEG